MEAESEIRALRVGPEDRLVIVIPDSWEDHAIDSISAVLRDIGLADRAIILAGDVKLAAVSP